MHSSRAVLYICSAILCIFIYIFYTVVFPIIPYDGDDWRYIAQYRSLLPSLKEWNPARVFQEVLHPFLGYFSAYIVYPICGNYLQAISISIALLLATSITALCMALYFLIEKVTKSTCISAFSMFTFMLMSFVFFKVHNTHNIYLFFGDTLNGIMCYVLPNILNSIIVLYIMYMQYSEDSVSYKKSPFMYGVFFVFIYLSQFSMTFSSLISATYAAMTIFIRCMYINEKNICTKVSTYIKTFSQFDSILFIIIICWICAAIFDMQGARYASFKPNGLHITDAALALLTLCNKIRISIKVIIILSVVSVVLRIAYKYYSGNSDFRDRKMLEILSIVFLSIIILTFLYILISARAAIFTDKIHATYGIFFFQVILTVICIAYIVSEIPALTLGIPFLLLFLFTETTNSAKSYARPFGAAYERSIVEHWLSDVRSAEAAGQNTAVIYVPQLAWPHPPEWFGEVFAHTLYTHGIVSRRMTIILKRNPSSP